jgi:Winged helix-turn helix
MKSSVRFAQPIDWTVQPIGRPKVITDEYVDSLKRLIEHSPQVYGYPFKRWTAAWLRRHLAKELGIEVSDRHINRLLQQMGLSTRRGSARKNDLDSGHYRTGNILIQDLNPTAVPEFDWPLN